MMKTIAIVLAFLLPMTLHAQGSFVYTDNNPQSVPNSVSAFSIGLDGMLLPVLGSPFLTGGMGSGGGFFASHHIASSGNFLYVANDGSNDISVFQIDPTTGILTLVAGSPFASGGTTQLSGMSLAVTPDGRFLYAGNGDSSNIAAFSITTNGALISLGSPTDAGGMMAGMTISPNGQFLSAAIPSLDAVAMFAINATGALTTVAGSPFTAGGAGQASDVTINCASNLLFDPKASATVSTSTIAAFTIGVSGVLLPVSGSPFTFTPGDDSAVGILTPDNAHLIVSNQASNTITVLTIASSGSLTQASGSPYVNPDPGGTPVGMGMTRDGTLLYVANFNDNMVTGFHVDSNGTLTPVTGSPFPTIPGFGLESLLVFPPPARTCL